MKSNFSNPNYSVDIKAIGIANFKAFKDKHFFVPKPLTLLVGPNSSGKSSLIHGLAYIHELLLPDEHVRHDEIKKSVRTGKIDIQNIDISKTQIGGDAIQLGGFANYVHNKNYKDGVTVAFKLSGEFNPPDLDDVFEGYQYMQELGSKKGKEIELTLTLNLGSDLDDDGQLKGSEVKLRSVALEENGKTVFRLKESGSSMRIEGFNINANNTFSRYMKGSLIKGFTSSLNAAKLQSENDNKNISYHYHNMPGGFLHGKTHLLDEELLANLTSILNWTFQNEFISVNNSNRLEPGLFDLSMSDNYLNQINSASKVHLSKFEYDIDDLIKIIPSLGYHLDRARSKKDFVEGSIESYYSFCHSFGRQFISLLDELTRPVKFYFSDMTYLGPLRKLPMRDFTADRNKMSDVFSGEHAWTLLAEDHALRKQVNGWLGSKKFMKTPYELDVKYSGDVERLHNNSIEEFKKTLIHFDLLELEIPDDFGSFGEWLKEIQDEMLKEEKGPGDKEEVVSYVNSHLSSVGVTEEPVPYAEDPGYGDDFQEVLENISGFESKADKKYLVLKDKRNGATVTHRDVGVGISQVLPVLATLFGSKHETIAIEQPELHLHPALQAELADVCIESAQKNKNLLVLETHSEHLILRIMRRIREGTLSHGDVSVIYVQPEERGSSLKYLRIDEDGDFIDEWPEGFFSERSKELF